MPNIWPISVFSRFLVSPFFRWIKGLQRCQTYRLENRIWRRTRPFTILFRGQWKETEESQWQHQWLKTPVRSEKKYFNTVLLCLAVSIEATNVNDRQSVWHVDRQQVYSNYRVDDKYYTKNCWVEPSRTSGVTTSL